MSSRRSPLAGILRILCFSSAVVAGVIAGTASSGAFAQSVTAGADRTLPKVCTSPSCYQGEEKVVVDNAGNAIAMWEEYTPVGSRGDTSEALVVSRFNATTRTWSASRIIPTVTGLKDVTYPKIGIDGSGNALLVWVEIDYRYPSTYRLSYARYIAVESRWTASMTIEAGPTYTFTGQLYVAKNGNAFLRQDGHSNRTPGFYYDAATRIWKRLPDVADSRRYTGGTIDEVGNVILPFERDVGTTSMTLHATRFNVSSKQMTAPVKLDEVFHSTASSRDGNFGYAIASKDRFGSEMVLWQKYSKNPSTGVATRTIKSARYLASRTQWISKAVAKLNNNAIDSVDIDVDRAANVAALWTQYVGAYKRVVSTRYSSTTGTWSTPKVISAGDFLTRDAAIEAAPNGNFYATWSQRSDGGTGSSTSKIFRTKATRYGVSSNTWGTPITIQDANVNSYAPSLDVDGQGRAVVIWNEDTPATDDYSAKRLRADRVFAQ